MKVRELRDKSVEELRNSERDLKEQLFKLRFQKATGQIENPVKIRLVRRDIARVLTILAERLKEAE
jgi:large subunit ribosomal protein L29